ncbi:hypothetical protein [Azorhizophilus paspali]|uniref:Uncharacterized protein n=1 Tax=Azorhizophilus paspali TaxID=69963 RepID=A0ABV6SL05_AZOPA
MGASHELIEPVDRIISGRGGNEKTFVLSYLDCVDGRKIAAMYPVANMPRLGDYKSSEEAMQLLLSHVGVYRSDGTILRLSTLDLIRNHVPDPIMLMKLEYSMLDHNFDFFGPGGPLSSVEGLLKQGAVLITQMLTQSLASSSQQASHRTQS